MIAVVPGRNEKNTVTDLEPTMPAMYAPTLLKSIAATSMKAPMKNERPTESLSEND